MNPHFVACDPTSLDRTVTLMGELYRRLRFIDQDRYLMTRRLD